jgi:hypothetical protein
MQTELNELAFSYIADIEEKESAIKSAYGNLLNLTQELTQIRKKVEEEERFEWDAMCIQERERRLKLNMDWARGLVVDVSDVLHAEDARTLKEARSALDRVRRQNASLARDYTRSLAAVPATTVLCKEIIASICGVAYNEVDSLLDQLLKALDADGKTENLDLAQLNGFMARVKQSQGVMVPGNTDAVV